MDKEKMEKLFYNQLSQKPQKKNSFQMSTEKYNSLVQEVKIAKSANKKANRHYWLLQHYDVLMVAETEHLIAPIVNNKILYYVPFEKIFDILCSTHESIGHGGRDRMRKELQERYKNITLYEIQTFLNLCELCLVKRKNEKKSPLVKSKPVSQFNSRCQVNFIDYQFQADGDYKFIMVYQNHLTKFVILRALKYKTAEEVAHQLLDIFSLFGTPSILQSDNEHEFCESVIENLKIIWPELKIIHEKAPHFTISCQDIENMINTWMADNKSNNWSKALGFIQFMKNHSLLVGIKRSPFETMFGQMTKVKLSSANFPNYILPDMNTEGDLDKILTEDDTEALVMEFVDTEHAIPKELLNENNKCNICDRVLELLQDGVCYQCSQKRNIYQERREAKQNLDVRAISYDPTAEIGMTIKVKVPVVN